MADALSTCRNRWRCAKCGEVFDRWRHAENHSNDTGHGRVEIVWGEA